MNGEITKFTQEYKEINKLIITSEMEFSEQTLFHVLKNKIILDGKVIKENRISIPLTLDFEILSDKELKKKELVEQYIRESFKIHAEIIIKKYLNQIGK